MAEQKMIQLTLQTVYATVERRTRWQRIADAKWWVVGKGIFFALVMVGFYYGVRSIQPQAPTYGYELLIFCIPLWSLVMFLEVWMIAFSTQRTVARVKAENEISLREYQAWASQQSE